MCEFVITCKMQFFILIYIDICKSNVTNWAWIWILDCIMIFVFSRDVHIHVDLVNSHLTMC